MLGDDGAAIEAVDFGADPEAARQVINGWVEEKTKTRIKELIPSGAIDNGTLVITVIGNGETLKLGSHRCTPSRDCHRDSIGVRQQRGGRRRGQRR